MKERTKGLISGLLISAAVFSAAGTAMAAAGSRTVQVDYNNIKVTLDGKPVNLTDVNGTRVEPFVIDGTTYLPVRAISSALGLRVGWNQQTGTVELFSADAPPQASAPVPSWNVTPMQSWSGMSEPLSYPAAVQVPKTAGELILDRNGLKIYFTGFSAPEDGSSAGYGIRVHLENMGTGNYVVQAKDLSVNGRMANAIFSSRISAGKTADDTIQVVLTEETELSEPITAAELRFRVIDASGWSSYFDSERISLS